MGTPRSAGYDDGPSSELEQAAVEEEAQLVCEPVHVLLDPPPCSCMLDHNACIKHFDFKAFEPGEPLPLPGKPPAHLASRRPAKAIVELEPCGITNIGRRLFVQRPDRKLGTMVVSNSGKPGGACALQAGSNEARTHRAGSVDDEPVVWEQLNADHAEHEEDLVSNWLMTAASNAGAAIKGGAYVSSVFSRTAHGEWGLLDPTGTNPICEYMTAQRVNYTEEGLPPSSYADAWVIEDVQLSIKVRTKLPTRELPARFDSSQQYPTALVFVAGPNVASPTDGDCTPASASRRTFNQGASVDYTAFRAGVKAALRSGLVAMAMRGCDIALLGVVSGGRQSGQWHGRLMAEYRVLVDEVLGESVGGVSPLGAWFELVLLAEQRQGELSGAELT